MARLRYDGLISTTSRATSSSATDLHLAPALVSAGGTVLPTFYPPLGSTEPVDVLPLSILNEDGSLAEIVHAYSHSSLGTESSLLSVIRGREGTTAKSHPAGVRVVSAPTAADYNIKELDGTSNMSSPSNGYVLTWHSGTNSWRPQPVGINSEGGDASTIGAGIRLEYMEYGGYASSLGEIHFNTLERVDGDFTVTLSSNAPGDPSWVPGTITVPYDGWYYLHARATFASSSHYTQTFLLIRKGGPDDEVVMRSPARTGQVSSLESKGVAYLSAGSVLGVEFGPLVPPENSNISINDTFFRAVFLSGATSVGGGGGGGGEGSLPLAQQEFSISTTGGSVFTLQHEPVDIISLSWVGVLQPPSEYSWDGDQLTLIDPQFVTEPGDKVTVVYTYSTE